MRREVHRPKIRTAVLLTIGLATAGFLGSSALAVLDALRRADHAGAQRAAEIRYTLSADQLDAAHLALDALGTIGLSGYAQPDADGPGTWRIVLHKPDSLEPRRLFAAGWDRIGP